MILTIDVSIYKECNLTAIAKKLCSNSHCEIKLKLFPGEAAQKPTLQEKIKTVAGLASFEEARIGIICFNNKKV